MASAVAQQLGEARLALDAGRPTAALEALKKAWADGRSEALAELIEALGRRMATTTIKVGSQKAVIQAVLDIPAAHRVAMVQELRRVLLREVKKERGNVLLPIVDALRTHANDPRLGAPLVPSLELGRKAHGRMRKVYLDVLDLVGQVGDPRSLPLLEAQAKAWSTARWDYPSSQAELEARLQKVMGSIRKRSHRALRPEEATLSAQLQTQIEAKRKWTPEIVETESNVTEAELWERIFADPDDDDPRWVLADLLQQAGDPRGEVMALSLRQSSSELDTKTERLLQKLIRQHAKSFLGSLANIVVNGQLEFSRGLPTAVTIQCQRHALAGYLKSPAWATIERVEFRSIGLVEPSAMKSLREIHGIGDEGLEQLAPSELAKRIESLLIRAHSPLLRLLEPSCFPKLRSLVLWIPDDDEGITQTVIQALAPQLDRLGVIADRDVFARWRRILRATDVSILYHSVECYPDPGSKRRWSVEVDRKQCTARLRAGPAVDRIGDARALEMHLAAVPEAFPIHVDVASSRKDIIESALDELGRTQREQTPTGWVLAPRRA